MSGSVAVISCVASFVALVVISRSCVVTGVSCVSFDLCIVVVVVGSGVVGVVGPAVVGGMGGIYISLDTISRCE